MKTILSIPLGVLLLGALAACGSPADTSHLVGAYVFDVDKTMNVRSDVMLSGTPETNDAVVRALQAQFAPEAYLLELRGDGSYALKAGAPSAGLVVEGTWWPDGEGIRLQANRVNGEAAAPEDAPAEEVQVEGDWLVLNESDQRIYLRRK